MLRICTTGSVSELGIDVLGLAVRAVTEAAVGATLGELRRVETGTQRLYSWADTRFAEVLKYTVKIIKGNIDVKKYKQWFGIYVPFRPLHNVYIRYVSATFVKLPVRHFR